MFFVMEYLKGKDRCILKCWESVFAIQLGDGGFIVSSSKYHFTAHVSRMVIQLLPADIAQDVLERMIAMEDHKFSRFGLGVFGGPRAWKGY